MPYRRSRLQDYYEELLGGKPSNGGTPAEPERGDSDGWLPSYIPPIEPPTARPELTSGESDGDDTPGPPLDVDPAVQDYERNLYQRLGINRADQDRRSPDNPEKPLESTTVNNPTNRPQPTSVPDDILEYEQRLYDRLGLSPPSADPIPEDIDTFDLQTLADVEEPVEPGHWQANTPLTPGQAMHVDHLLHVETDHLAREVLITLKREGVPPNSHWRDFLEQYALSGWYAASDAVAWGTLAKVANSDWDETLAHTDRPEPIIRQEEHLIRLRANGALKVYEDVEDILRGDVASSVLPVLPDNFSILVLDQYPSHPYAAKIYVAGNEYWIDLRDDAVELEFERIDEVPQVYNLLRAQVSGQEYDNTSLDFMSALTKALESQPIGVIHISGTLNIYRDQNLDEISSTIYHVDHEFGVYEFSKDNQHAVLIDYGGRKIWIDTSHAKTAFTFDALGEHGDTSEQEEEGVVSTETESEYHRQSTVPGEDSGKENVEISHRVYADRTWHQLGWLTRDYNTTTNTKFYVQSPVIGPDVRVELVIHAESDPESRLGNYVVISFPAFVYLSDPKIMQTLKMQNLASQRLWDRSLTEEDLTKRAQMQRMARLTAHDPERWQEDGRIIIAYAHLSHIEDHIVPGLRIDAADKSLIGKTGNTGKGIQYHHLDLLEVIVGSSEPGSGALERMLDWLRQKYVVEGSQDVQHFFDLVIESQLYPHGGSSLYSENLDTARTHPELDDTFGIAQYIVREPDPKDSIYLEDE